MDKNNLFLILRYGLLLLVLVVFYIGAKGGDTHGNLSNVMGIAVLLFTFWNWRRSKKK